MMIIRWLLWRFCKLFRKRRATTKHKYRHTWLTKSGDRYSWQVHMDGFYTFIWRKMDGLHPQSYTETPYVIEERKYQIFKMWLKEVPSYLKMGSDLEQSFKAEVIKYLKNNYNFDPYNHCKQIDETPTPRQQTEWWNI